MVKIKALGGREKHCELEEGFGKSHEEAEVAMSLVWWLGYDDKHASSTEREAGRTRGLGHLLTFLLGPASNPKRWRSGATRPAAVAARVYSGTASSRQGGTISWVVETVRGGQVCVNVNGIRSPYF